LSSLSKKIQAKRDKQLLKDAHNKTPKTRCKYCKRFTLFYIENNVIKCLWCKKGNRD